MPVSIVDLANLQWLRHGCIRNTEVPGTMTQIQSTFQPTKTYKVDTAYSQSEATIYDDKRFTLPSGKRIHQFELDQLMWGVRHVDHSAKMLEVGCGTVNRVAPARKECERFRRIESNAGSA